MTMPGGGSDRQVNVTVNANVDPFVRSMSAANAATLKLGTALKSIDDRMVSLTKKLGVTAMGVGGAGLIGAFGDVKQAAALQQSMSALAAQATQTGTSVGDISTGLQKMSTQIPVSTQALAQMATQIAQLGVTGTRNILTLTKQAEQLSAATNTAPGQLFTQLIQMNQSLGGSLENLQRYGSVLTTIQNQMGVSATDTMQFANSIQAVAQKAGISEQNILALSAAFAKVGADGASGAQAFNQIMNAMTDAVARNSSSMLQFTQVMGITTDQFKSLVTSNPTQAFVQFIQAIAAQGSKASITLQALGLDSTRLQRVFAALTSGQANLTGAIAQSNAAFTQNTATAQSAAAAWDTVGASIDKMKNGVTQIRDQLGAPLLGPVQALTDGLGALTKGVSNFIHFADDAPWPIGDTIAELVTKTPALLLLGGAFITLTAAVSKFAGVWRMMTGAIGINAFRGFLDGRGGSMPREIDGQTGRLGSMLYRTTFGLGQGNNMIGVNARRGIGSMIAGYPLMRARQQFAQSADTLLHPFSPEKRNNSRTDPLSMYGMWQQGSKRGEQLRASMVERLRNTDGLPEGSNLAFRSQLADRLENGFGAFDDSAEGARRRRFQYVEQARWHATQQQQTINSTLGRRDLMDMVSAGEAGQYYQQNGTLNGYQPTDFSRTSLSRLRKMGNKQAGWIGDNAATKAGDVYDASLSEEEAAKLANPFQKLANKVTEITDKLVKTTGAATKSVFGSIETFFGQAMAKIQQMAAEAISGISRVQAAAQNPGSAVGAMAAGAANAARGLSGWAGGVAGNAALATASAAGQVQSGGLMSFVSNNTSGLRAAAKIQAEEAAKVTGGALPSAEEIAGQQVIGFPGGTRVAGVGPRRGVGSRNTAAGDLEQGVGPGFEQGGGTSGGALRGGALRRLGTRAFGEGSWVQETALPNIADAGKAVASGLGAAAGGIKTAITSLMSPQLMIATTLLGPALYNLAKKVLAADSLTASNTMYAGQTTQQNLGRQVLTPAQIAAQYATKNPQSDNSDLFTTAALHNSQSGDFKDKSSGVLDELKAVKNTKGLSDPQKQQYYQMVLQQEANGDVLSNGGTPLDQAQKQQLAEYAMAFTGSQSGAQALLGGQGMSGIDLTGKGNQSYFSQLPELLKKATGDDRTTLLKMFGSESVQAFQGPQGNLAGALYGIAKQQQDSGGNTFTERTIPQGRGAPARAIPQGSAAGFGNDVTQQAIAAVVQNYNAQNPNAKVDMPSTTNSIQAFYADLKIQAKNGDKGSQNLLGSMDKLGLTFDKTGALTQSSLDKLKKAADGAATALTQADPTKSSVTGDPLGAELAYRRSSANASNAPASLLDLLNTPDATNYSALITKVQQQMVNDGSNPGGQGTQQANGSIFNPQTAQGLRAEADALEKLKQTVANGSQQWRQLDQLEQGVYGQLSNQAMMGGGGLIEQTRNQVANMQAFIKQGFNDNNASEFNSQQQSTEQVAQQDLQTLDQYYIQVRDAHISMQREAEDHQTQMVRMERDYNRQMGEAQYQFGVQTTEANYQYNVSVKEQEYQRSEQIRQMKYAISQSLGTAGSMVQAQYTQGAQSGMTGFAAQTQDLKKSLDAMNGLKAQGLSSDAIRMFKLDDPANFAQAQRYLSDFISNPALVKSFNDEVAKNLSISDAIAQNPNNSQFADLERSFNHTADVAATAFTHSAQVAQTAFDHSMTQSKIAYDTQMQDFQADYDKTTARSLDDLSRLGEDTQKTWQDLVSWAQNSGIPGIVALGASAAQAISLVQAATQAVNNSMAGLSSTFNTTLSQISTSLQAWIAQNPAIGRAFAQANGISMPSADTATNGTNNGSGTNQGIVQNAAKLYGWSDGAEWNALVNLVNSESGFNNTAQNPSSTAYGMFQFLDSTWATVGATKSSNANAQTMAGLAYIYKRYGDPINAWAYHQQHNSYATGSVFTGRQTIDVGEAGPEAVIPLNGRGSNFVAQTVLASIQMMNPGLVNEVRRGRTAPYATQAASNMSYHHTDASTHYNGDITVVAQDPNEMGRKLAAQRRLTRLQHPAGSRR